MNILSLAYLGNVQYFTKLCFSECVVDLHEHYHKQSYRTRCDILTANGPAALVVPVVRMDNFNKLTVAQTRIDYSKRWQHQHWQSIVSAYRGSPYFDFYGERFAPFYTERRYDMLADWNLGLMREVLDALGCGTALRLSDGYVGPGPGDTDWRNAISPKPRLSASDPSFSAFPYYQVFSDRLPFVPNLSVIDLLFCEGPGAADVLRKGRV